MGKKRYDPFGVIKGQIPKYLAVTNIVLIFDVVGFTKRSTNQEMERIIKKIDDCIQEILWEDYNWNEKTKPSDIILIPTGDGYGIGFHPTKINGKEVLSLAVKIHKYLIEDNSIKIKIRMGVAKGPNIRFLDKNDITNLFGYGINTASRVLSVALENQILVHEDLAKELLRGAEIKELVEVPTPLTIKHGEIIKVYNYYKEGEFGNSIMPTN